MNRAWPIREPRATIRPLVASSILLVIALTVATKLEYDPRGPLVLVALQVLLAVVVGVIALMWLGSASLRRWAADFTVAVCAVLSAAVLAVALHGSTYMVGGLGIAAANRTPAVARYIDSWRLADYSYRDLPAFYPPLMPWVTGRLAAAFDAPPYLALKVAGIVMLFLAPVVAYVMWRSLLPTAESALVTLALVALISVTPSMLQQPDSLLALAAVVPWWLNAICGLGPEPTGRATAVLEGFIGGLIFCLYYYYFLPLALALLLMPLIDRWHPPPNARPNRRRGFVIGVAAAVSSIYWLPLMVSIAAAEEPVSLQNRWFTAEHATLHVDLFDASPVGLLMLAGLAHALFTTRRDRVSAGLAILAAAGFAWYLLALTLAVIGMPVLAFRTEPFIELVLIIAGVRALTVWAGMAMDRWKTSESGSRRADGARTIAVLGAVLAFVVGQSFIHTTLTYIYVAQSHDTPRPDGRLQPYAGPEARRPAVSINRLERSVRNLHGSEDEQPVVLSTSSGVLKISGMYAFNQWHAIYAHPAGEFYARVRLLRTLADQQDPRRFAAIARDNDFDAIDVVVLKGRDQRLTYEAVDVDYPDSDAPIRVTFERRQFSDLYWRVRQVGPYVVAAAR
jgi:galactan 5-O-arabinofuranosyltransferase